MEISAPFYVGALVVSNAQTPEQNPIDITRVNPSETADQTGMHPKQTSQATENTAYARQLKAHQELVSDMDRPAGPSPSFDISVLEIEQDLKQEIARMEAARGRTRDAQGIAPGPDPSQSAPKTTPTVEPTIPVEAPDIEIKTAMGLVFEATPSPI